MEGKQYDYLLKILMVGDASIGKTSTMLRYMDGYYNSQYSCTIGVDFRIKTIDVNEKKVKVQLWDTAGAQRFKSITAAYYRGCHVFLLMFDVTSRDSFEHVNHWHNESLKHGNDSSIRVLVGNKCDLYQTRQISVDEAQQFASSRSMIYLETSAKQNIGIDQMMNLVCAQAIQIGHLKAVAQTGIKIQKRQKSWIQKNFQCC